MLVYRLSKLTYDNSLIYFDIIMNHKVSYTILFIIPGLFASFIIAAAITGIIAGVFWLFIFGDNIWPEWTEAFIGSLFVIIFLGSLGAFAIAGYQLGISQKPANKINRKYILISIGSTAAFIAFMFLYAFSNQIRNSNNSFTLQCHEACKYRGHSGSSTPPENLGIEECSCFDDSINEWIVLEK